MQTTILQTNTYFRSSLLSEIGLARKRRNGWHDERARRSKAGRGRSKRLSQIWSTEIFENGKNYYHTLQNRPFLSRFLGKRRQARSERGARDARDRGGGEIVFLRDTSSTRGSPSSKCKHRRTSTLLHTRENLVAYHSNYKDLYGKKNLRKWKDFNKKQLTLHKVCVTSLLCVPWADLWPFNGLYCKRFSLYIKVYQAWSPKTIQWNPINTVTNGPKKKMAVTTRWRYYRGGRKAEFHCITHGLTEKFSINKRPLNTFTGECFRWVIYMI